MADEWQYVSKHVADVKNRFEFQQIYLLLIRIKRSSDETTLCHHKFLNNFDTVLCLAASKTT